MPNDRGVMNLFLASDATRATRAGKKTHWPTPRALLSISRQTSGRRPATKNPEPSNHLRGLRPSDALPDGLPDTSPDDPRMIAGWFPDVCRSARRWRRDTRKNIRIRRMPHQ